MKLNFLLFFILLCAKSFSQEKDLDYYIKKAQNNSPLLADYSNQIKAAAIDSLLNRASYKPQVAANLNASYAPVINGVGYDTALSNGQVVSGLVGFNQRILGKNQSSTQADSFKLIKDALALNKKIAVKDLNKAITTQYITAWGTATQIEYNKKITALLKEENTILKKLTQNSVYKQTDYLIFNTTVKQQELTALQLKQQFQNDLSLLNYLAGETNDDTVTLKQPEIAINELKSEGSVFLMQFETDSLKIQNGNKLIDNNYKPSLSLLGDAGYNSSLVYQAYKNFGASVGLGLKIPIYDGDQRKLQHQKNNTALETIKAYKNNFEKQYKQQIFMLYQKLNQVVETAGVLNSQLNTAEALIDANKKLLLTGDAQITEYIIALSNLVSIQDGIAQNNISKLQIINELNYWKSNE